MDLNGPPVEVLSPVPLAELTGKSAGVFSAGLAFPFCEYRSAMNSDLSAKAMWAHRMQVSRPDGLSCEIVVLQRRPDKSIPKFHKGSEKGRFCCREQYGWYRL